MQYPIDNLERILFLDIETATVKQHFDNLEARMQHHWAKRSNRLARFDEYPLSEEEVQALYNEKAAIFAEFSRVICISLGILVDVEGQRKFRIKSLYGEIEKDILHDFSKILSSHYYNRHGHFLCGHNIKEFDIPFLCRRYLINGIGLPNLLNIAGHKPWQVHHLLDTLEFWKFGDYKHYTSLDLLCSALGVASPKMEMSGDKVNNAFWEGRLKEIVRYCETDLVATTSVYLKCIGKNVLEDDEVITTTIL